jgi:hypothetical protein
MEGNDDPLNKLLSVSLPRLLQATSEYHGLACSSCSAEEIQLLGELTRRIKQCDFLLRNVGAVEQRQFSNVMNILGAVVGKQADADMRFEASCQELDVIRLFTETFYWVAHRVNTVVVANHASFRGKRLPKLPRKLKTGGVTIVRNHLLEHPFEYSETFGLGGMWRGPVLNGGVGQDSNENRVKDSGLFFNAIEWAETITDALLAAVDQLKKVRT